MDAPFGQKINYIFWMASQRFYLKQITYNLRSIEKIKIVGKKDENIISTKLWQTREIDHVIFWEYVLHFSLKRKKQIQSP